MHSIYFLPKDIHEKDINRIGCYMNKNILKGTQLYPIRQVKNDCYPDAEFSGLWGMKVPSIKIVLGAFQGVS